MLNGTNKINTELNNQMIIEEQTHCQIKIADFWTLRDYVGDAYWCQDYMSKKVWVEWPDENGYVNIDGKKIPQTCYTIIPQLP